MDERGKRPNARRGTTTIRISREIRESIKEFQAQFHKPQPSLTDLVENAWREYQSKTTGESRLIRLGAEERKAVESLIDFLNSKSPRRRPVAKIVESLVRVLSRRKSGA